MKKKIIHLNYNKKFKESVNCIYDADLNWLQFNCKKNGTYYILDFDEYDFDDVKDFYNCLAEYINKRGEYDD